jgi:signal transduction histidine kinase
LLALSLGLAGLGLILSNSHGAAQVARNASQLHWTNATLGASGIARAAVAQAVFFSHDDFDGSGADTRAIEEAAVNLDFVTQLLDHPDASMEAGTRALVRELVAVGRETISLAESGQPTDAELLRVTSFEPAYQLTKTDLTEWQEIQSRSIWDTEREAGRTSRITFVAISFLIPAVTMIVFWLILRRRVLAREMEMRSQIDAEKALNRAKDEFIAGLSHELRTPLTSIVGFSELLVTSPLIDVEAREQLGLIHGSASDLTRMVEDLLVAARIDADALSVKPESIDLAHLVKTATSSYEVTGDGIVIDVPPIEAYADPLHVRQIVHNLVSNALRHGGGRVVVTATHNRGKAVLVVADDGPGVPPELEERLFQRFLHEGRLALVAGSVGLGLAISRELAHRMGGSLRYGRVHGWTAFTLTIPTVPAVTLERSRVLTAAEA